MLAIVVGVSAGYFAGSGGELLSLLSNIFLVIPGLPLLIVLTSYVPQASVWVIALVLSIVGWAWGARVLRAQTLALRQQDFVQAARAAGESNFRIILFEILPNEVAVVATNAVFAVVGAISFYVAIVFLGLGDINTWSWGTMLYYAENNEAITSGAWWWYVPPGIAVALILLALVMLNFGIDEFINPRLRAAGIGRKELRAASRQQGITPVRANRPNVTPVAVGARHGHLKHGHLQAEDQVSAPSASLAGAGQPVLEIRDLCVDYGRGDQAVHAVIDTDLTLRRGEVVGLAGESGSGKSTLAYGATRLLRQPAIITGGSVLFRPDAQRPDFAIDILDASPEVLRSLRWRDVAIVFQSAMNSLNPVLTVQSQLTDTLAAHIPDASKTERRERAAELLKLVGISADRLRSFPHELSGGMKQRVMIAMALALEPQVVIMDEPTTALDVVTQRQILEQVMELRDQLGFSVLFITHDLSLLLEMADTIAIMYAGRIVESAPAEQLFRAPRHPYSAALLNSFPSLHGERKVMTGIPGSPPDLRNAAGGLLLPAPLPLRAATLSGAGP